MNLQQNNLLKEFIEKALSVKKNQFQTMQREFNQVDCDFQTLIKMIEEEKKNKKLLSKNKKLKKKSKKNSKTQSSELQNDIVPTISTIEPIAGCSTSVEICDNTINMSTESVLSTQPESSQNSVKNETESSPTKSVSCTTTVQTTTTSTLQAENSPILQTDRATTSNLDVSSVVATGDTSSSSFSLRDKQHISAYNSIHMGLCEHLEAKHKCHDLYSENSYHARRKKMNLFFYDLQKSYFDRCKKDHYKSIDSETRLLEFKETLNKFTLYTHLRPLASLSYVKETALHNIVSSIEFDKDSEFFAIAGVAKKIKIFEYASVVRDSIGVSYPTNEIECTSKISCLCWNPYYKSMMVTSDYEGNVVIWDAFLGQKMNLFSEHERRCWSVDFNKIDVNLVASGSDDATVKLWSSNVNLSLATIQSGANICSVKFNPKSLYHLAFASADHRVYYYDLRNFKSPLMVFKEHRKAVSYVNFLNDHELVSASTDSQIKLWDTNYSYCLKSYKGHVNEKNFVGLTANDDYIACGSENNSLYIYYKGIERSMLTYAFDKTVCISLLCELYKKKIHFLLYFRKKKTTMILSVLSVGELQATYW